MDKVKNRIIHFKISPFKGDKDAAYKFKKNDAPNPHSYKQAESFFNTQVRKENMSISKTKNTNFAEEISNKKKFVPGIGKYDITKADKVVTLGVSRGWK